jgi:hypothetical protein
MQLGQGTGPFPLPAVPEPRPCSSRSRRLQQRASQGAAATELANNAIRSLNNLHMCLPSRVPPKTRNPTSIYRKSTLRAVAHVHSCAKLYVSRLASSSADGPSDDDLFLRDTRDLFTASYACTSDALPLTADAVALPSEPASVDLLDILPPELARRYSTPRPELFVPKGERKRQPQAVLVRSPADYAAIIRRMHGLGMVVFTTKPKVVNGIFGTAKSGGAIRLVVDGRRANAAFAPSPKVELPTPDLLARLQADPDKVLYAAKADLDNYYHRIRVPAWMHPYFALPSVQAGDVGVQADQDGNPLPADAEIWPCCTTLPMGWSHSAYLAQEAHQHIVDSATSLNVRNRISRKGDFRLDRPRFAIYIDDFMIFGSDPDELELLLQEYMAAIMQCFARCFSYTRIA